MHRVFSWIPLALTVSSCAASNVAKSDGHPAPERVTSVAPAGASVAPNRRELIRALVSRNVRIHLREGEKAKRSASGVVVGSERTSTGSVTYILTNAHAVDLSGYTQPSLSVVVDRGPDSYEYGGEILAMGKIPEMDLALLRVRGVLLPAVDLAQDDELELGSEVVVVAAPYGRALSLSGGLVSQVEWDREMRVPHMLKTDAAIGYGASGGGVYSLETGRLLAIVEGYRTAKVGFALDERDFSFDVPMPGETFAAPTAKLRRFLELKGFGRLLGDKPASAVRAARD